MSKRREENTSGAARAAIMATLTEGAKEPSRGHEVAREQMMRSHQMMKMLRHGQHGEQDGKQWVADERLHLKDDQRLAPVLGC